MLLLFAAALAIQVDVRPTMTSEYQLLTRPSPDTYTCSVSIVDAQSEKAIGTIRTVAGMTRPEVVINDVNGYHVEFTVRIRPGELFNTADVRVTVTQGNSVVAKQGSTVSLLHIAPYNTPVH